MKESVSQSSTTSKWTHRIVKHVNRVTHLFICFLPCLIFTGPNKSTPQWLNGGSSIAARHCGRLAMNGNCFRARFTRQKKHLFTTWLIAILALMIQYASRMSARTCSGPTCPFRRCVHSISNRVAGWLLARIGGCFIVMGIVRSPNRPPTLRTPSLSTNGHKGASLLDVGILWPCAIDEISSLKAVVCTFYMMICSVSLICLQ